MERESQLARERERERERERARERERGGEGESEREREKLSAAPPDPCQHRRLRPRMFWEALYYSYLTESVYKVGLQKSIPAHIRQLILDVSNNKGYVTGFVRGLTFA